MEADAELVRRALARDQQAFAALYDRYADKLFDYARRQTGNSADAGDIVQDTFVLAIQRLEQLRDPSLVRPWLYAIARSEVHRRHRRVNRLQFTEPDEQAAMSATGPTPDELVHQQELRTLFTEAANGLDPADREVLDLHLRHSMTSSEIAAALGIPERQVSVVVQRVRERLGRSIGVVLLTTTPKCPDLIALQRTEGTPLTVLSRKRLARHIEGCVTCSQQLSERMRPETLLAALPIALAPAFLRDSALARMASAAHVTGGPGRPGSQGGPPGPPGVTVVTRPLPRREHRRVWQNDGFPRPASSNRLIAAIAITSVAILLLFVALVIGGGDSAKRITAGSTTLQPAGAGTEDAVTTPTATVDTTALSTTVVPTTLPAIVVPTTPSTTPPGPTTTAPDTSAPVFQSASASPTALGSENTTTHTSTCSPSVNDTTAVITVNVTDDRSVAGVTMHLSVDGIIVDASLSNVVGNSWQTTIGPFGADQVTPDVTHQINASFTATDAVGNARTTNVNNIATLTGCTIIL